MINMKEMMDKNLRQLVDNEYPGRGIIIGATPDKRHIAQIYFIMGRSENSRNRIFVLDNGEVRTQPFDASRVADASLIIYNVTKTYKDCHIVTNGDQTDTVYSALENKGTFESALDNRTFEPDPPIYTPRISGIAYTGGARYSLCILKQSFDDGVSVARHHFNYGNALHGYGHMIHVYNQNGNPPPSFSGEPRLVPLFNDIGMTLEFYWDRLNGENKISIMAKYIPLDGSKPYIEIINKNR